MAPTMFQRYGGFARIDKLVLAFYDRMLDSERVGPYFEGVDLARLIDHQAKFTGQIIRRLRVRSTRCRGGPEPSTRWSPKPGGR